MWSLCPWLGHVSRGSPELCTPASLAAWQSLEVLGYLQGGRQRVVEFSLAANVRGPRSPGPCLLSPPSCKPTAKDLKLSADHGWHQTLPEPFAGLVRGRCEPPGVLVIYVTSGEGPVMSPAWAGCSGPRHGGDRLVVEAQSSATQHCPRSLPVRLSVERFGS